MKKKHRLVAGILAVMTFSLGLLANSTVNGSQGAEFIAKGSNNLPDQECKNKLFAPFCPRQHDSRRATADITSRSRYISSRDDDLLALCSEMVALWVGYTFSKEYNAPRGHMHAIEDIIKILRAGTPAGSTHSPQPGTCWTCKNSDIPRSIKKVGLSSYYSAP